MRKCVYCNELRNLKAENKRLQDEQNLMFMLLDLTLTGVEKWGQEHGLLNPKKDLNKCLPQRSDQVSMFFDQIGKTGKEAMGDRFRAIFDALEGSK